MERLQGKEWHDNKHNFKLLNYSLSNSGNIRVEVKDKTTNERYSHWLNEKEKAKFLPVKDNYRCLDKEEKS